MTNSTTNITAHISSTTKITGIKPGVQINHQALCDFFGIPPRGCIRESKPHGWLVLISDQTRRPAPDQWNDDILHFVGSPNDWLFLRGRLNRLLAKSSDHLTPVHLFNKHPLGRYEYVGPVKLADHPYSRENRDQDGQLFIEWIFPLRLRSHADTGIPHLVGNKLLPYACSAVIGDNVPPEKLIDVFKLLDQIKSLGCSVVDARDIEELRHRKAWATRQENVIRYMEKEVKARIQRLKKEARRRNRAWSYEPDELELDGTYDRIKSVLELIGYGGEFNDLLQEADSAFLYPDPPAYYALMRPNENETDPSNPMEDYLKPKLRKRDFSKIDFGTD